MTDAIQFPADNTQRRPIAQLLPDARNSRTHSAEQVKQLAASMVEFGFTNAILLRPDEATIIAGHGRVMAAELLVGQGREEFAYLPTMIASNLDGSPWSDAQIRAFVLADNKLALNAGWDMELLAAELHGLETEGFELDVIGFSPGELQDILGGRGDGLTDPDAVPEAPVDPVAAIGDTWLLGKHRLRCGDSTSADDVAALLAGVEPHLMVTDPPYGVEYDPDWRNRADRANGKPYGARAVGQVANDDRADWREAWALFPGDVAYVWHGERQCADMAVQLRDCAMECRNLIVWSKSRLAIGRGHYHSQHETCWYAVRKGKTGHWSGDRKQTTLWQIEHRKSETGHGTQKPVEAMRRPIVNNSSPGQAVYEPFSGSGTTIIAGEMEGRSIYAMELDPIYVDVAVKRWQDFTGEDATLEDGGETFATISAQRLGQ